ncbi:hypothetical protein ACU686_31535 [Yinghuangia aomiensis]
MRYLDRPFAYDTMTTPLALQSCPREVGTDVLGNLRPGFRPRSVLDVGGHLGQFAGDLAALRARRGDRRVRAERPDPAAPGARTPPRSGASASGRTPWARTAPRRCSSTRSARPPAR